MAMFMPPFISADPFVSADMENDLFWVLSVGSRLQFTFSRAALPAAVAMDENML
jgi:hypothetical protein